MLEDDQIARRSSGPWSVMALPGSASVSRRCPCPDRSSGLRYVCTAALTSWVPADLEGQRQSQHPSLLQTERMHSYLVHFQLTPSAGGRALIPTVKAKCVSVFSTFWCSDSVPGMCRWGGSRGTSKVSCPERVRQEMLSRDLGAARASPGSPGGSVQRKEAVSANVLLGDDV